LILEETISTDGGIDNLDYDHYSNRIQGAIISRLKDVLRV